MVSTLKLPVGIDSFEKIRRNNFYYIDKTKLIEQLVETVERSPFLHARGVLERLSI